jgi:hypothetical protein
MIADTDWLFPNADNVYKIAKIMKQIGRKLNTSNMDYILLFFFYPDGLGFLAFSHSKLIMKL